MEMAAEEEIILFLNQNLFGSVLLPEMLVFKAK